MHRIGANVKRVVMSGAWELRSSWIHGGLLNG